MTVKQVLNTSAELDFPNVLPTLDLDFANSKTLDPRITFTRSSGGSYVGADGFIKYAGVNEPRFDHDPATGESLGLLVEETRSNSLERSQEFDNAYWTKGISSALKVTDTVSPDGLQNAYLFIENASTGNDTHTIIRNNTYQSGVKYCFSIFAKAYGSGNRKLFMLFGAGAFPSQQNATFDLITGTVSGISTGNGTEARIEKYPNGWYRCTLIGATTISTTTSTSILYLQNGNTVFYPGDGVSGVYIWGAQIEQGSFPTSYIPTTTSTRTRVFDNTEIINKNFSDWYRQDEGTIYSNYITRVPTNVNQNNIDFVIENGASTNRIIGWNNFGKNQVFSLIENNIANYVFYGSIPKINIPVKKIIGMKDYDVKMYVGTDSLIGDFASSVPDKVPRNLTRMVIGVGNGFSPLNGTITHLTYWPKRLPNSQLISLTI